MRISPSVSLSTGASKSIAFRIMYSMYSGSILRCRLHSSGLNYDIYGGIGGNILTIILVIILRKWVVLYISIGYKFQTNIITLLAWRYFVSNIVYDKSQTNYSISPSNNQHYCQYIVTNVTTIIFHVWHSNTTCFTC